MASKRRNMFYENKKQETTEIVLYLVSALDNFLLPNATGFSSGRPPCANTACGQDEPFLKIGEFRAEIRASVFLALEEQDVFKDKSPFLNKPLKDYVNTTEGALIISLVREFLEFFNLEFTSMVFDPETHKGIDYKYEGRSKLASDLFLNLTDEGKNMPLLDALVRSLRQQQNVQYSTGKEYIISSSKSENEPQKQPNGPQTCKDSVTEVNNTGMNGDMHNIEETTKHNQLNDILSKLELDNKPTDIFGQGDGQTDNFISKLILSEKNQTAQKAEASAKSTLTANTGLSSLAQLPPLNSSRKPDNAVIASKQQRVTDDLKDLLDLGVGDPKYEDDFMSSTSEKLQKEKVASDSEQSEIEEEVSTPSNHSLHADDATVDVSISKASVECDYLEDI
ncbi:hypothetical protein AAG570_006687 [Ranatra chinensis]|uniref:FGFR1 oncogene partner (FOP) N-terminal dimerisation domain-containing protein n=1 Tax=Ranatra chinensis TaxID=642074 RepID=A0ABD0ZI03_9HEMI